MRSLLLFLSALAVTLCLVPLGMGVSLLITPRRAGAFLNEAFAIFPPVEGKYGWQNWFYRALGVGSIALSGYFCRQIWGTLVLPVMRGLQ
jgi:hypothetical protein